MTATIRQALLVLVTLCLLVPAFAGCGDSEDEGETAEVEPLLGLYNLPISLNNQASAPSNALRIEINPDMLRADGHQILELQRGRAQSLETPDNIITALGEHIRGGAARRVAAISIHTNAPYLILVQTLNTLQAEGLSEVFFQVRAPGDTEGWMPIRNWQVVAHEAEIEWESRALPWEAFTEHWSDVYEACRAGQYIDCDGAYANTAEGGTLAMELWTRGQGMKITFSQIPPTEEEGEEGSGGVAMIEGIAAPQPAGDDEELGEPATGGAYNFRQQEAAAEESAISATVHPVCANQACRAEVVADATGASMRVISMIGAVFPNGYAEPEIAFRIPE